MQGHLNKKPVLGVLGGMGPLATLYFYELLILHTQAVKDADHLDVIISGRASTYKSFKLLLQDKEEYNRMSQASNPYGDGFASKRIADVLEYGRLSSQFVY